MSKTGCARAMLLAAVLFGAPVAQAAAPAGVTVERTARNTLALHWTSADPVDVRISDRPDAPPDTGQPVAARVLGGQATLAVPQGATRYIVLTNARTGEWVRTAERVVDLEAGSNFRDIGGYDAAKGRHVRWGLIFRSGGTPLLTPADTARIAQLGLAELVDLRSDEERVLAPTRIDGVPYSAVGYAMGKLGVGGGMEATYRGFPQFLAPQLKLVFDRLLDRKAPLAYNCSAGQDRTGFVTAMILSALGTPRAQIIADYHLSTKYRRPEFEMPHLDVAAHPGNPVVALFARYQDDPRARQPQPLKTPDGTAFLDFAFAEIEAHWGSPESYLLQEIGLSDADLAALRERYTE